MNLQGLAAYVASLIDRTLQWRDIQWLRTVCNLPVGVLDGAARWEQCQTSDLDASVCPW